MPKPSLSNKVKTRKWKLRPELLLCPHIPKPLHQVNPRTILGQTWWDQKRKEAYQKTDFHCAACGVWKHNAKGKQYLEAHEFYRINYARGRMYLEEIVALCHYCHNYIHSGRLQALMEKGEISQSQFVAVIQYGNQVLAEAGLKKPKPYAGKTPVWSKWRLILNRRHYGPKYESLKAWEAVLGNGQEGMEHRED